MVKHAKATTADLLLEQEDVELFLKVRDDGKGISPELPKANGIGLRTIQNRVHLLNGTFLIDTPRTGKGTQISIRLPSVGGQ